MLTVGMTWLLYEWNELERARAFGEDALHLLQQWGHPFHIAEALIALAKIADVQGKPDVAQAYLDEATAHAHRHNLRVAEHWALETAARFAWAHGDTKTAQRRYRRAAMRFPEPHYQGSLTRLHAIRPLILERRYDEAQAALGEWETYSETRGLVAQRVGIGVLRAMIAWRQQRHDTAANVMASALLLAEPGGFVRTFLDEGPVVADLLRLSIEHGATPTYAGRLLEAHSESVPALPDPLSPREEEVLHLIAAQLSNQEIADTLVISINTVKTHIRRLYDKLGVGNRLEAVTRAQELHLI
jgi:LuxR family maltose regulon positive regulatory protein